MGSIDVNKDGCINFEEFVSRFQVVFTKVRDEGEKHIARKALRAHSGMFLHPRGSLAGTTWRRGGGLACGGASHLNSVCVRIVCGQLAPCRV